MFCMDVPRTVLGFTHVENFKNVGIADDWQFMMRRDGVRDRTDRGW